MKYWLPALIWMAVVFSASADARSGQHSSRIIAPVLRFLFPHIAESTVELVVLSARKCAHVTEYAVLGILFWRVLRRPVRNDPRPWSWKLFGWSLFFVLVYAASDEFHQIFVPTREPSFRDVTIDVAGGLFGLLLLWAWRKKRLTAKAKC